MIDRLYELVTGTPWTTVHSAAAEFGCPPGALYAEQLAQYSDAELIAYGPQILAEIKAGRGRRAPELTVF
ncbi:hypothetical protein AB0F81_29725 [Actinoplanes sp. NPDC024001]|uniref:hypothetical protein n=1 Tax=Actinoplanes sp. NPDC024001 TaxID=3154598 RepID=UPI0033D4DEB7